MRTSATRSVMVIGAMLCLSYGAWAQQVGTIAGVEGTAEIGRGGTWAAAALGGSINRGDEIRTGRPGRLRLVFQDDSVVAIADESRLTIDENVFDPAQGTARSLLQLITGKVRAVVSDYYHRTGNAYEVKTVTAVLGVRGTDFIAVYDAARDVTDVVGVSGWAEVHGLRDLTGHAVFVTAGEISSVVQGKLPTPARRLDDALFRQYLEGFEFIGAGRPESLTIDHPLIVGTNVPDVDRCSALPTVPGALPGLAIAGPPPSETLPEVYTRDASNLVGQPIPVVESAEGSLHIRLF